MRWCPFQSVSSTSTAFTVKLQVVTLSEWASGEESAILRQSGEVILSRSATLIFLHGVSAVLDQRVYLVHAKHSF